MVNILHNEYESDFDKELAIIESENDIEIGRAMLAVETCFDMTELSYAEAELQCMKESGDFERLTQLYQEAGAGTEEKTEGALSKLFGAIANAFRKLKNFLFGEKLPPEKLEQLKKSNKDVKVSKEDVENGGKIVKVFNGIKGLFSNPEGNQSSIMSKLGPILGITAAAAGGTVVAYKTGKIANLAYDLGGVCDFCIGKADEFKNTSETGAKGAALKVIGGGLQKFSGVVSAISGAIVKPLQNEETMTNVRDKMKNDTKANLTDKKGLKRQIENLKRVYASETDENKKKNHMKTIKHLEAKLAGLKNKGNAGAENTETPDATATESVDDFFNIEMPDEFVESTADASEIYDLLESIM